tara:strand:+ start:376 stop:921 length:546 start_codon:yes stop_codon:yes gene_type:complete
MKYKIDKDIEVPKVRRVRSEMYKVVEKMKPGDSIFVITKEERGSFVSACSKLNYAYVTRKLVENNASNPEIDNVDLTGWRCWVKNGQNLEEQRKKNISTKKQELLGDNDFLSKSALGLSYANHDEVCEPRGSISAEVLTEAIQKSNEFKFSYNRTSEYPEDRNDFTKHDSKGDLRPLKFDD